MQIEYERELRDLAMRLSGEWRLKALKAALMATQRIQDLDNRAFALSRLIGLLPNELKTPTILEEVFSAVKKIIVMK